MGCRQGEHTSRLADASTPATSHFLAWHHLYRMFTVHQKIFFYIFKKKEKGKDKTKNFIMQMTMCMFEV